MKKIFKLASLLFFTINVNCQVTSIVPLRSRSFEHPNGVYIKDLDNELLFYVDTWEGVLNNKKYTFEFVKFTQHLTQYDTGYYHYRDVLKGKFKVVDLSTGITLYDNLAATAYEDYNIFLASLRSGGSFSYMDVQNCYNSADFQLYKVTGNPNQLYYNQFSLTDFTNFDCPYQNQADIPMFLPTGDLILTRQ